MTLIIEVSKKKWTSKHYDHFTVTLHRVLKRDGSPHHIDYVFTCKDDPINCRITRGRMQMGDGTTNMGRKVKSCLERRGIPAAGTSTGAQQTLEKSVSQYTKARHRVLIALRC